MRQILVLLGLSMLTLVGTAVAKAPPDQYARFGGGSTEVRDSYTKLKWDRDALQNPQPGQGLFETSDYLEATNACPGSKRLPSAKELLSIVDEDPHQVEVDGVSITRSVDSDAFPSLPVGVPFWSISQLKTDALGVSLADGLVLKRSDATMAWRVLCVNDK
jgi:Protein of unknown function (DUF1566)